MNPAVAALMGPAALGAVFATLPIATRIAARHRDIRTLITVVDMRTYREAANRIPKLIDACEPVRAHSGVVAMLTWLDREAKTGRPSRRDWCHRQIAEWTICRAELADRIGLDGLAVL